MDSNDETTGGAGSAGTGGKRPQEEVRDELQAMGRAAADLLEHLIRVPAALAQIPLQMMPDDAATHARNAASEGFKAVKTLLDTITTQVDQAIADQNRRTSTHTGVGTHAEPSSDAGTQSGGVHSPAAHSTGETDHAGHAHDNGHSHNGEAGATRRFDDGE